MGKRVLIIDFDPDFCVEMTEFLRGAGIKADYATTVEEGEAKLCNYNVLLLNYRTGKPSGFEILKKICKKAKNIAIFLVTGEPNIQAIAGKEGLSGYIRGYVEKPFDPEDILDKIKAA